MAIQIRDGLTYDDVLLVPKRSSVVSRREVSTKTRLSRHIEINVPLVSANMDTVTESSMAITMARLGGIGIIHRFLSVDDQVKEVLRVKRSESILVEKPFTLPQDKTLADAQGLMDLHNVTGIPIVDSQHRLVGILTSRDMRFETDLSRPIAERMTKRKDMVVAAPSISVEEAKEILRKHRIEKLPLVDKNDRLYGLMTGKDILKSVQYPLASKDKKGRLMVGAAIGVKREFLERANALIEAGVDVLVVDIAHGHSDLAINTVKQLRKQFGSVEIIAGNVATAQGAKDLAAAGADAIKVGVGPGSICITRIVTGAGVPQITAILDSVSGAGSVPIIADGGIRTSGDLTKALAAGASSVMIGNMLAGTDESPGVNISRNGRKYKVCRGMASFGADLGRKARGDSGSDANDFVPEGVEAMVPYRGSASEIISHLAGGLRSGISYCGAKDIRGMQKNAEFVKISNAGLKESHAHDVEVV